MQDQRGNPVGTASSEALQHAETALWRMCSFFDAPLADLDAAIAADPGWMLPHVMRASFLLSLTEPSLLPDVRAALEQADLLAADAPERERALWAAASRCAAGDWHGACAAWEQILLEHPRDLYALQWAHLFDFYRGDARNLRGRVARVLPEWPADDALRPYLLGMHAFGLEECGLYAQAEGVGREALAGAAKVPWATHAVAHVMEMQGRHAEGQAWLRAQQPGWAEGNGFAGHLWWHLALFHLEAMDLAGALALHDAHQGSAHAVLTLQRLDGAALLWRLHLLGAELGARWGDMAQGWDLGARDAGHSAFNDVHALLVLIGLRDRPRAEALLGAAQRRAERQEARRLARDAARRERLFDRLVDVAARLDPDFAKAVADLEAALHELDLHGGRARGPLDPRARGLEGYEVDRREGLRDRRHAVALRRVAP